jgi:hypothetical protein
MAEPKRRRPATICCWQASARQRSENHLPNVRRFFLEL